MVEAVGSNLKVGDLFYIKAQKNPLNSNNTPLEIQRNIIPSNVKPLQLLLAPYFSRSCSLSMWCLLLGLNSRMLKVDVLKISRVTL